MRDGERRERTRDRYERETREGTEEAEDAKDRGLADSNRRTILPTALLGCTSGLRVVAPGAFEGADIDREEDDHAFEDFLRVGRDAHEVQAVVQHAERERADQRADD